MQWHSDSKVNSFEALKRCWGYLAVKLALFGSQSCGEYTWVLSLAVFLLSHGLWERSAETAALSFDWQLYQWSSVNCFFSSLIFCHVSLPVSTGEILWMKLRKPINRLLIGMWGRLTCHVHWYCSNSLREQKRLGAGRCFVLQCLFMIFLKVRLLRQTEMNTGSFRSNWCWGSQHLKYMN